LEALHVESHALSQSKISEIVNTFPPAIQFEHELEEEFSPFKFIPEEVVLCVLRFLDHTSIERLAAISRKARVLTLDSSIWR
jgi:F-box protein 9